MSPTMFAIDSAEMVTTSVISNVTLDVKPAEPENNKSLSTIAIINIVGASIVCILLCVLFYCKRKRGKQNENQRENVDVALEMAGNTTTSKQTTSKGKKKRFVTKSVAKWSNGDVLDWIDSLSLSEAWHKMASEAVQKCKCNGKDIAKLQSKKEVNDLFCLDNPMLNSRLWKEIKIRIQPN
eukprot:UN05894